MRWNVERVEEIVRAFVEGDVEDAFPFGDGHINETYYVRAAGGAFVCQRVRKAMNVRALEKNYLLYSEACTRAGLLYPVWMQTKEGKFFYEDLSGDHWRAYPFIEGEILTLPLRKEDLFSCGQGLAKLHESLQTVREKPDAVYPMHHDLKFYHDRYLQVIKDGLSGEPRDEALEEQIRQGITEFAELKLDRSRVIHGDPKLANILFQKGTVKAFLDFDTVAQGSLLEDLADCIRSCCISDGKVDAAAVRAFLQGYQSLMPDLISREEAEMLPEVIRKLFFELGLRYYTDAIATDKAFREKYPGYLLEKARGYFRKLWDE